MSDIITGSLNADAVTAFQTALRKYRDAGRRTNGQVLNRKGKDLSIKLGMEFSKHAPSRGQIHREAQKRHQADGQGTKVRKSIARSMDKWRLYRRGGKKLNWQAEAVRKELSVRERGRGIQGVAFYFRDWKTGGQPAALSLAKQGRQSIQLGKVRGHLTGDNQEIRISGFAFGQRKTDERTGAVHRAVAAVMADMAQYLDRKQEEALLKHFRKKYPAR